MDNVSSYLIGVVSGGIAVCLLILVLGIPVSKEKITFAVEKCGGVEAVESISYDGEVQCSNGAHYFLD